MNTYKKVLRFFLVLCIVLGTIFPNKVNADVIEDSESWHVVTDSNKEPVLTVLMKKGEISIEAKSRAATTNTRWRTIGFTVSMNRIASDTYRYITNNKTYDLDGWKGIDTLTGSVSKEPLWLSRAEKVSLPPVNGITTTNYKFTAKQVERALGESFENITKDTPIYLHAIFQVYTVNGSSEIIHTGESDIRSWKQILLAEWWNPAGLNDFAKYFNMKLEFQPARQDITMHYIADDGVVLKDNKKDLTGVLPGQEVKWLSEPVEKVAASDSAKKYTLYGFYVVKKNDTSKKKLKYHYVDDTHNNPCKLENIQSNNYNPVPLGGIDIFLLYKKVEDIKMVIKAVDINDNNKVLKILKTEAHITQGNHHFPLDNSIDYGGATYKKTVHYSISYKDKNEKSVTTAQKTDNATDPIKVSIFSDIKLGSTVEVKVYYDKIVSGDIPVTINAVRKSTGATLKQMGTDTAIAGETFTNGSIITDKLTIGAESYVYTGEWRYSYKQGSSTVTNTGSGKKISFKAPSFDKITGRITVDVYYDLDQTKADEISLRVIMVSSDGTIIDQLSSENVTRGQSINKPIAASRSVNGLTYRYINKWDYLYTDSSGNKTNAGSGNSAAFTVPAATKLGSTITLRLYYEAIQGIVVPEASAPITVNLDTPTPYGVINGDRYSSPYFTSEQGIPTTESQYVLVKTKDYLLGYTLTNRTGKVEYYVPVKKHYTIEYLTATPVEFGGPKTVTEVVTDTRHIKIEKVYSYWEITNLEFYYVEKANVYNYSLPGGNVLLTANSSYLSIPTLTTRHNSRLEDHVIPPRQVTEGIEVWEAKPIKSGTSDRPDIEYEDLTSYAINMTEDAIVANDYLMFNGSIVLSDVQVRTIAPMPNVASFKQSSTIINDMALFTENRVIDAVKENGVYPSNGVVTYKLHSSSVNATYSNRIYSIDVNSVTIHTPVICDPVLVADNDKWVQVINPVTDALQIVLDPDTGLNDFTLKISNTLQHGNRLGYTVRDFSKSFIDPVNVSYIAKSEGLVRNEVKFPFDIYIDILKDNNADNDKFLKAGTWFVLGRDTYRFYVPMWVKEGNYTVEFRTVAVNGEDKLSRTETTRNASRSNYVATSTKTFQISGRIYGLTLYDISDYPKWEDVFRKEKTMLFKLFEGAVDGTKRTSFDKNYSYYYTVGTKNQYGNETGRNGKYTLPLVNGSHPKYNNLGVLKTGYAVRFMLDTTGEMYSSAARVKITPTFYYVDADGKNRRQVDLYYKEEVNGKLYNIVKVGEGIDLVNIKSGLTGNIYSRIPESELRNTAKVMGTTYNKITKQYSAMYSYNQIKLLSAFRTFIERNYADFISSKPSFVDVLSGTRETRTSLSKYTQRWYGTYKMPTNVYAVQSGYDVFDYMNKHGIDFRESFWLKGGYIIVNFNIVTLNDDGKENLSYINANNYINNGNCSMWIMEGAPIQKIDGNKTTFNFKAGDFIIYYTDKKYSDDFEGVLY